MIEQGAKTLKRQVIEALERLPDNASVDDIVDSVLVVHGILQGLAEVEAGMTFTQEEAKERMQRWLA